VKNESWWSGTPYIDSILGKSYATNDEARDAFYNGEIDLVDTTAVYANTRLNRSNANNYKYLTSNFELLALNNTHSFFQDKVIKKAMAYGIDRKDIILRVYLNNAETVDVPIPSSSWLYDSSYRIYDYDAKRASRLLEEAGWRDNDGDGILDMEVDGAKVDLSFTILTNSDNGLRKDAADLIVEQLSAVGFEIQVEVLPWDLLLEERMPTGEFDAILTGFSLEPMHDLRSILHTDWMGEQGNNFIRYNNDELDHMLDSAAKVYTEEDRLETYQRIQKHLTDELPVISLYFRTDSLLVDDRVRGIDTIGELDTFRNIKGWFLVR
jgi:peptide/nickel transport system substrate-binding protein